MSTLEILIALTIFTVSITAVVMLAFGNQSAIVDTEIHSTALSLAQEMLEEARAVARNDWDAVVSTSTVAESFTRSLIVSDADDFMKSIRSNVAWQLAGQTYAIELTTLVEDAEGAAAQGACASNAESDWLHPTIASTVDLGTTGPLTDVDVKDGIAYVTADGNDTLPDFFVVDVATSSPQVLWSLHTGPGLMAVQVVGGYAYVANSSVTGQLQVINLQTHSVQSHYRFLGGDEGANTLYYYNHYVYLGTPKSAIKEFHIIDVSDPNALHEVGAWEFNVGINAIYVSNNTAYVAASQDMAELTVLDVNDLSHIKQIGSFDAEKVNSGKSFARGGVRLYLGRTHDAIASHNGPELNVLNINKIDEGLLAHATINSSVNSMVAIGDMLFLSTTDAAKDFQVWHSTSDGSSLSYVSSIDLSDKATAVDCEGQTIYLTTNNPNRGLLVLTAP